MALTDGRNIKRRGEQRKASEIHANETYRMKHSALWLARSLMTYW
jgi:hypothetical protein